MKLISLRHPVILTVALQIGLVILTLSTVFGQSADFNRQLTMIVDVAPQADNPLAITLIGVDNSAERVQTINLTIQNTTSRKIKSYSLLLAYGPDSLRSGLYTFQSAIIPGQLIQKTISESRANIKEGKIAMLSVDYVVFEDGSSWGKDSKKESEFLTGFDEGQKKVISKVQTLLRKKDTETISKLLQQEDFEVDVAGVVKDMPANWQLGFSSGYKSVLIELQTVYKSNGIEAIPSKLEEFVSSMRLITNTTSRRY